MNDIGKAPINTRNKDANAHFNGSRTNGNIKLINQKIGKIFISIGKSVDINFIF